MAKAEIGNPRNDPGRNCPLCPRLVEFRDHWRATEPDWFNAPVPTFGAKQPKLLVVGLAPGIRGANRTGRPFTGDYAGDLLYDTMIKFGFATGQYAASPDDTLKLVDAGITNAVRCVPPQNKPVGAEISACRPFLSGTITDNPQLRAILVLGRIAHDSTVRTLGLRLANVPFSHGGRHDVSGAVGPFAGALGEVTLFDSYHCSRYNTNTRRLTVDMFEAVFADIAASIRN